MSEKCLYVALMRFLIDFFFFFLKKQSYHRAITAEISVTAAEK